MKEGLIFFDLQKSPRHHPHPTPFSLSHLAPQLAPRVFDDPVRLPRVRVAPVAADEDGVVEPRQPLLAARVVVDAGPVQRKVGRARVHGHGHGALEQQGGAQAVVAALDPHVTPIKLDSIFNLAIAKPAHPAVGRGRLRHRPPARQPPVERGLLVAAAAAGVGVVAFVRFRRPRTVDQVLLAEQQHAPRGAPVGGLEGADAGGGERERGGVGRWWWWFRFLFLSLIYLSSLPTHLPNAPQLPHMP